MILGRGVKPIDVSDVSVAATSFYRGPRQNQGKSDENIDEPLTPRAAQ
jgi:hypothetical protein